MYVRVYAPNGEPFDVTRERADRLILQDGWTQSAPIPVPQTEPETAPVPVEEVPVPDAEEAPEIEETKKTRPARGRKISRRNTRDK